jgi:hypothetical protein
VTELEARVAGGTKGANPEASAAARNNPSGAEHSPDGIRLAHDDR